jgi:hypothetical protein
VTDAMFVCRRSRSHMGTGDWARGWHNRLSINIRPEPAQVRVLPAYCKRKRHNVGVSL